MSIPTSFPAWVQLPDGRSAMVVDINGYRAAVAAGGVHTVATPAKTTIVSGGRTQTIQEIALANDETDARPGTGRNR
jgi:hypothetical protein